MSYEKIYYNGRMWNVVTRETMYNSIGHGPELTLKCRQANTNDFGPSDFNDFVCEHYIDYSTCADKFATISIKKESTDYRRVPQIKNVIFNNPATIVFWADGTKTVVKCGKFDIFDPEKGLAMAIAKKALSNHGNYYNEIRKWVDKYYEEVCSDTVDNVISVICDALFGKTV